MILDSLSGVNKLFLIVLYFTIKYNGKLSKQRHAINIQSSHVSVCLILL